MEQERTKRRDIQTEHLVFSADTQEFDVVFDSFTWGLYENAINAFNEYCLSLFQQGFKVIHKETDDVSRKVVILENKNATDFRKIILQVL